MANPANPAKGQTFQSGKESKGRQDKRQEGESSPERANKPADRGKPARAQQQR